MPSVRPRSPWWQAVTFRLASVGTARWRGLHVRRHADHDSGRPDRARCWSRSWVTPPTRATRRFGWRRRPSTRACVLAFGERTLPHRRGRRRRAGSTTPTPDRRRRRRPPRPQRRQRSQQRSQRPPPRPDRHALTASPGPTATAHVDRHRPTDRNRPARPDRVAEPTPTASPLPGVATPTPTATPRPDYSAPEGLTLPRLTRAAAPSPSPSARRRHAHRQLSPAAQPVIYGRGSGTRRVTVRSTPPAQGRAARPEGRRRAQRGSTKRKVAATIRAR